jgi:outer membrane protein assembly factor BamB
VTKLLWSLGLGSTLLLGAATNANAEDWPTFRGEDRTAVSTEKNLLDKWPAKGPKLLWSGKGAGRGYASPAVANGRIYTLGDRPSTANDQDEYLTCFDEKTGKQLWMTKTGGAWNEGPESWQGSRGTPTVDGELVYVISPFGKLFCCKTSDGSVVWQKDLKADFGGSKKDSWGYSESPLIDGQMLLCTPGGKTATVVALDKANGELIWKCVRPDDEGAGHASVVISEVGGQKVYVQNTAVGPMGIAAKTGELLWSYYVQAPTAFIPTAIVKGDLVYSVAGYNSGAALLQQIPGSNGDVSIKEVYGLNKSLSNKHGGVVLVGDKLYFGKEDRNIVQCADLKTGKIEWEKRGAGDGSTSVIAGDGKLFIRFQNGVVSLAKANPNKFEAISSFTTPGSGEGDKPSWAHPVIANGNLLLREGDTILCYDISK